MDSSPDGAKVVDLSPYGGRDPRDLPRYTYKEASRATDVPASTVACWVRGMPYSTRGGKSKGRVEPLIDRPDPADARLSFHNLCETYALRALRETHEIRLRTVREAISIAEERHGIKRLLISPQLRVGWGELFLDTYLELESLSRSEQLALRDLMEQYLKRVDIEDLLSSEICPIPKTPEYKDRRLVSVSPLIAFGRPRIKRLGISTRAISERFNLGEPRADIMGDYGLRDDEFTEALLYEARNSEAAA